MEKYVPDIYQKSIYTIDYDKLKARGIKCLLYDLDNTLVPFDVKEANQKIKNLFDELKEKGFKVIIFSNSPKTRLKPFKEYLDGDNASRWHSSWYGSDSNFVDSSYHWFVRGGNYICGVLSGTFSFDRYTGGVYTDAGFRLVLTP